MKNTCVILFLFILMVNLNSQSMTGVFNFSKDIGEPKLEGGSSYDTMVQKYNLKGAGYNIWFERDEFHYLYNELEGDFILTANFGFEGEGMNAHRKIGWMIRESDDAMAAHISATLHGDGLTVLQWRELRGAFMRDPQDEIFTPKSNYTIIQLERKGNTFIMRAAHPGEPLQYIGEHKMRNMPKRCLAGLFICSHDPEVLEHGVAWNVRIDREVPASYNAYEEGRLACRLEIMDVSTGERKVVYEDDRGFEAPNWTPDGKELIINMEGGIYRIPVTGGALTKINTGEANRNNNDHGISPDGKLLAISSHREGMSGGGSTIYVVPLEGGTPKMVTSNTPSYWHGWSPDSKSVIYVGQRGGGSYHLYRADIETGTEVQLTNFENSHVDGPEYGPDGKYIYYNGTQSGTMQIWRMDPDGSNPVQLTFDEYNDWFPHISPDGQSMVFISFPSDIEVSGHPFYKRVMLRTMPVSGGAPKVLAYLYGGQGTINVPSWSPDSKKIAFVSNPGWHEKKKE
ncbi:MAG: TolB family protein [Saprospiraceae bacterium]|nr:TolB family protein [Saprospiraceae bacterium]